MPTPSLDAAVQQRLLRLQLPQRLARVCQRGENLHRAGWDINTLYRLADDSAWLAEACRALDAPELAGTLSDLHASTAALLDPPHLPDQARAAQVAALIARLARLPLPPGVRPPPAAAAPARPEKPADPAPGPPPTRLLDATHELGAAPPAAGPPIAQPAPVHIATASERSGLAARMRHALAEDEFQVVFQPIVSLRDDDKEQFQALLRLAGENGRVHAAGELIPAAARAGLLGAVDQWVLEHCVALIVQRTREGRPPRLFISQSLDSVCDAAAPARLRALLAREQVAADAIALELRLADASAALADARSYAAAMKALGVHIALAGVDADADGERILHALPIDWVKLAPHATDHSNDTARQRLRGLIDALHERGLQVIAPHVEDARGAAALCSVGVDFIQGNFVQAANAELVFDFRQATL